MNISAAIVYAADILRHAGVSNARREAASLLTLVLQRDAAFLIAHGEYELTERETTEFENAVRRRANREPFQYIAGRQEFYGLDFEVNPDVLIPRPETETLVEAALPLLSAAGKSSFFEIGTGSGCISVSMLYNLKSAVAVGVDLSGEALVVAARNAEKHGVAGRLTLRRSDVFEGLGDTFDLIVSNPPYIPTGGIDLLQAEVRHYEPHAALAGGTDGLDIVRRIVSGAPRHLKTGGHLLIEIGFDQATSVKELFDPTIWKAVDFIPDLQGIARVVRAALLR